MARLQRTALSAVVAVAWIVYAGCSGDGPPRTPGPASEAAAAPTVSAEGLLSYAEELTKRHRLWEENQIGQWRLQEPRPTEPAMASPAHDGKRTLDEAILASDTIARVELISVSTSVRRYTWASPTDRYVATLEFRFRVHEYLKGGGPDEITAFVSDDSNPRETAEEAQKLLAEIAARRQTRWDDRQALVFMAADWERIPDTGAPDIYYMGTVDAQDGDGYQENWLPAASATVDAGGVSALDSGGQEFLLKPYRATPTTIRLDDLKAKIESLE